jgi:hypothetical protein
MSEHDLVDGGAAGNMDDDVSHIPGKNLAIRHLIHLGALDVDAELHQGVFLDPRRFRSRVDQRADHRDSSPAMHVVLELDVSSKRPHVTHDTPRRCGPAVILLPSCSFNCSSRAL